MKPAIRLSARERFALWLEARNFYFRYRVGRFIDNAVKLSRTYDGLLKKHSYERLPNDVLREAIGLQADQVDASSIARAERWRIKSLADQNNDYADAAREVAALLDQDPTLSPVANIGARVDVVSAFLAGRYPNVQFQSVDLQPNLKDHNCTLPKHPNWAFHPGYALDMLESGALKPALVLMMFTACKMTPKEFSRFLDACKSVRAFVLCEVWKPNPLLRDGYGYLTSQTLLDVNIPGYTFIHDYAAELVKRGFEIKKNDVIPTCFSKTHPRHGAQWIVVASRATAWGTRP